MKKFGERDWVPEWGFLGQTGGVVVAWPYDFPAAVCCDGYGDVDDDEFERVVFFMRHWLWDIHRIMWWCGDPPLDAEKFGGGA